MTTDATTSTPPEHADIKRAVLAVVVVFVPMLPSFLLGPLGVKAASGSFLLGTIAAMLAAAMLGPRYGLMVAAVVTLFTGVAVPASTSWVSSVFVMALAGFAYAITSRKGIQTVLITAPISVAFTIATPPVVLANDSMWANAAVVALVTLGGGLWGVLVGGFLGRNLQRPSLPTLSPKKALTFAVTIAIVVGVAMAFVVGMDLGHGGAWLILTLIIVIQPGYVAMWKKTTHRVIGTVLGFGIALAASLIFHQPTVVAVLAMALFATAVYIKLDSKRPYWQFVTFLTPGIVLIESAGSSVLDTDVQRLGYTLLGCVIAVLVMVVFKVTGLVHPHHE